MSLEALRCACGAFLVPPVLMCVAGHSACPSCSAAGCSQCPGRAPCSIHNIALDNLAAALSFPCPYCEDTFPAAEINSHLLGCTQRKYPCPSHPKNRCSWRGVLLDLKAHLKQKHAQQTSAMEDLTVKEVRCEFSQSECFKDSFSIFLVFGEIFQFTKRFSLSEKRLNIAVQHFGANGIADKFEYEMQMNKDKHQMIMSNLVHDMDEDVESVLLNRNCISVDFETLVSFGKAEKIFVLRKADPYRAPPMEDTLNQSSSVDEHKS